jgi:hypothetical protein
MPGQMEYASVILLAASGFYAFCLVQAPGRGARWRLAWLVVLLFCLIFIGEEISWGEGLHGPGVEAIRSVNSQHETTLHNISVIQQRGMLHSGWFLNGASASSS